MKEIYKLEADAIRSAQIDAIRSFEKAHDITLTSDQEELLINDKDAWLRRDESCQCNCGETPSVEMVLFEDGIKAPYVEGYDKQFANGDWKDIQDEDQYRGSAGICEHCGQE